MGAVRFADVLPSTPAEGWTQPSSFEVPRGVFALFVVPPGVGIDLVRMLVGLREPAAGTVEVLGERPVRLDRRATQRFRQKLGVAFDEPTGLVSNLTLRMNLVVPMIYSGLRDETVAREAAEAVIEAFGLGRWADRRPADVPPEIRREAAVARAVVRDPQLLLLEEPTSGVRDRRAEWLLSTCRARADTVVATTAEREGTQYEHADMIFTLDHARIEIRRHEAGVLR